MSTRGVVDDRRSRWRLPLPDARHVPWVYVAGQGGGTLIATTVSSVLPVSAADEQLARGAVAGDAAPARRLVGLAGRACTGADPRRPFVDRGAAGGMPLV